MANNSKHMDNLKNFRKGQSGNPGGRPSIPNLDAIVMEEIGEEGIRAMIQALHKTALKGNTRANEILLDRIYGKAKETLKVEQGFTIMIDMDDANL